MTFQRSCIALVFLPTFLFAQGGAKNITYLPSGDSASIRTVEDKLRETVSLTDFGALCDGATDDSSAMAAAVTALPDDGGVIYIPPSTSGCYFVSTWYINKRGVRITGSSANVAAGYAGEDWKSAATLKYGGTGIGIQIRDRGDGVILENFTLLYPATTNSVDGDDSNGTVENKAIEVWEGKATRFHNLLVRGTGKTGTGIFLQDFTTILDNVNIENFDVGVWAYDNVNSAQMIGGSVVGCRTGIRLGSDDVTGGPRTLRPSGFTINGVTVQYDGEADYNVEIKNGRSINIVNSYFENDNSFPAIAVGTGTREPALGVTISSCYFSGNLGTAPAVQLKWVTGVTLADLTFTRYDGGAKYVDNIGSTNVTKVTVRNFADDVNNDWVDDGTDAAYILDLPHKLTASGRVLSREELNVTTATLPCLVLNLDESDGHGLWRLCLRDGPEILAIERNSSEDSDFSTYDTAIKYYSDLSQAIGGHMLPAVSNTVDIGSNLSRWKKIYTVDLDVSGGCVGCLPSGGTAGLFLKRTGTGSADYQWAKIPLNDSTSVDMTNLSSGRYLKSDGTKVVAEAALTASRWVRTDSNGALTTQSLVNVSDGTQVEATGADVLDVLRWSGAGITGISASALSGIIGQYLTVICTASDDGSHSHDPVTSSAGSHTHSINCTVI